MTHVIFLVILILICAGAFFLGYRTHEEQTKYDLESLAYYRNTWKQRIGGSIGYGNYRLESFDGGKNWYAVDHNSSTGETKILGTAEEKFPGLLKHLEGMDALVEYAEKHGAINPANMSEAEKAIVDGAGLKVVRDK